MKIDFIQIGSNVGNTPGDYVYPRVASGEFTSGILIDANPRCMPFLKEVYKGPKFFLENCFISAEAGSVDFHIDNYDIRGGTSAHASASLNFMHAHRHGQGFDVITTIKVESTTLEALYDKYKLESANWLFVDAEGYDYQILRNTNFYNLNINHIQFEHSHTEGPHQAWGKNFSDLMLHLGKSGYYRIGQTESDTIMKRIVTFT